MSAVLFYHLTGSSVDQTVRTLLTRALDQSWRVVVRGTQADRLAALDRSLWLGPEEEFLPHGMAGGPHDRDQPVLLTTAQHAQEGADALMLLDGAALSDAEARALQRVWVLFEGADPDAVQRARELWRSVSAWGVAAQYWSDEAGRWEKKRDVPAAPQL